MLNIIVTGGAGFIGSAVVRELLNTTDHKVCNLDKLTYAGNLESLASVESHPNYSFEQADIADHQAMEALFANFQPDIIMNLAAESHVDRSIDGPAEFMTTNIMGTFNLLEVARAYTAQLAASGQTEKAAQFRFHHISTDEVFGTLGAEGLFTEETPYAPNSPYSSSKASSDHLVRAWHETYGLPTVQTNCSNNYGPFHFPEKLIPLVILNALEGKALPVYGDGKQVRDWLYVEDHARALIKVVFEGKVGETYNVGGHNEKQNIEVVTTICEILDELRPRDNGSYKEQITFVADRPGHDQRYAIDASKIQRELGWQPEETFESGIRKTVEWYLNNGDWCDAVTKNKYSRERIGLNA